MQQRVSVTESLDLVVAQCAAWEVTNQDDNRLATPTIAIDVCHALLGWKNRRTLRSSNMFQDKVVSKDAKCRDDQQFPDPAAGLGTLD